MSSPTRHKRKSLTNPSADNLETTSSSSPWPSSRSSSPANRAMMKRRLRETASQGWPSSTSQLLNDSVFVAIKADDVYRQIGEIKSPKELFEKAKGWIATIRDMSFTEDKQDIITAEIYEVVIRAIFGSNQIERAGLNLELTVLFCRKIFSAEEVGNISEGDSTCHNALLELYHKQAELKDMPKKYVFRARNEVVQHARAFQHIIHAFVVEKQHLSEDLIKQTHRILVKGVPIVEEGEEDVGPEKYGGVYRTVVVGAGTTNFTVPQFVPRKMEEMCAALKEELIEAENKGTIDPFSVASKYSLEFVQIHPFQDGNGRMCRMILNAILCRYAGVIVPIGEESEERTVYMGIKRRASQEMEGHGEYASFVLGKACPRLREMKKKLTGKRGK
ncbi:Filamentation induced by cAMP/death on curing-related protein [Metarhizium rileyi]|uniref:Filamentation induced by cAMP/death on curing-related protein n=1 Tax=Metarhizium rileyi (strain RCEF 4871) TaxID=1649241 RepID=A0A167GAS5_METRR|nr:Filamentation induced by cAMP/death on curing-related protein [Metarhizium rileyi RCEF 4871]